MLTPRQDHRPTAAPERGAPFASWRKLLALTAILVLALPGCQDREPRLADPGLSLPQGNDGQLLARAGEGDIFAVDALLQQGANVNARASNGATPLMGAAYFRYPRTLELLLARGADVNAQAANGATALHYAASGGSVEVVEMLLRAGADPQAKAADGSTPLVWAEQQDNLRVARLLRETTGSGS
jgi:ankyrin repeat protein